MIPSKSFSIEFELCNLEPAKRDKSKILWVCPFLVLSKLPANWAISSKIGFTAVVRSVLLFFIGWCPHQTKP